MAVGNFLGGTPEIMTSYRAQGPVAPGAEAGMSSRMVEGAGFADRDHDASVRMSTFMSTADRGIRSYNSTAAASGRTYLEADEVSRTGFAVLRNETMRISVDHDPTPEPTEAAPR